jgi:hypothetical protein
MFKQNLKVLGLVLAILIVTGAFFVLTQSTTIAALKP